MVWKFKNIYTNVLIFRETDKNESFRDFECGKRKEYSLDVKRMQKEYFYLVCFYHVLTILSLNYFSQFTLSLFLFTTHVTISWFNSMKDSFFIQAKTKNLPQNCLLLPIYARRCFANFIGEFLDLPWQPPKHDSPYIT